MESAVGVARHSAGSKNRQLHGGFDLPEGGRTRLSRKKPKALLGIGGRGESKGSDESIGLALKAVENEIQSLLLQKQDLAIAMKELKGEVRNMREMLQGKRERAPKLVSVKAYRATVLSLAQTCPAAEKERKEQRLNWNKWQKPIRHVPAWKGYSCAANPDDIDQYLNFDARGLCPDDWLLVHRLLFLKGCSALPPRSCRGRTPQSPEDPTPLPQSLFSQEALKDENVRWGAYDCKSFACLNARDVSEPGKSWLGHGRGFNMSVQEARWKAAAVYGNPKVEDVVEMKKGPMRVGLDVGGGAGSFAARMAQLGVTVLTMAAEQGATSAQAKVPVGVTGAAPYIEAIALRGLVPLWAPLQSRLPFFDNTLDLVHAGDVMEHLTGLSLADAIFEWDRVLRPGGVLWLEGFHAPLEEMPLIVTLLNLLKHKRLHWSVRPKLDENAETGAHVHLRLDCVMEKPARHDQINGKVQGAAKGGSNAFLVKELAKDEAYRFGVGAADWSGTLDRVTEKGNSEEVLEESPSSSGSDETSSSHKKTSSLADKASSSDETRSSSDKPIGMKRKEVSASEARVIEEGEEGTGGMKYRRARRGKKQVAEKDRSAEDDGGVELSRGKDKSPAEEQAVDDEGPKRRNSIKRRATDLSSSSSSSTSSSSSGGLSVRRRKQQDEAEEEERWAEPESPGEQAAAGHGRSKKPMKGEAEGEEEASTSESDADESGGRNSGHAGRLKVRRRRKVFRKEQAEE